jgi:hypothetical protein
MRTCKKCGETRPLAEFPVFDNGKGPRHRFECSDCMVKRTTASRRKRNYGVDTDHFDALFAKQAGRCAICHTSFVGSPHLDHCHTTGKVRGLLCGPCNRAIGLLGDDAIRIRSAALYVTAHQET